MSEPASGTARLAATLGLLVTIGAAMAGCAEGANGPSSAAGGASPVPSDPRTSFPAETRTSPATVSPAPSDPVTTDAADPSTTPVVVDPRLLAVLPSQLAGVPVVPSPDSAARMIEDESLAASASAVAVAMAAAPGASGGDELAVATVIQLRPGVYTDDFFARWRAAYDQAACEPAGGVGSHVQQTLGGHRVEVTLCTGGARTYNLHLPGDRLVSVTSVGGQRFGELLLAGLHE